MGIAGVVRPLGRVLGMLGALVLLFGLAGVFLWWLITNYDEERSSNSSGGEQAETHRRRNRGHKGKKRKQRGGKYVLMTMTACFPAGWAFPDGVGSARSSFGVENSRGKKLYIRESSQIFPQYLLLRCTKLADTCTNT